MPVESNEAHSKGIAVNVKSKLEIMPYAEMDKTESKLVLISKQAAEKPEMQFTSLAHLLNKEFLRQCFYSLNRNKAVGVDNENVL